jgi:hypothetical protein
MLRLAAAIAIAASVSTVGYAQNSHDALPNFTRGASLIQMHRIAPPALRWDDPGAPAQTQASEVGATQNGTRSKGRIAIGLGLIGGGLALMIANPDVSEYGITSSGDLYRKTYRIRLAGGIMAGSGGLLLWSGMRRK